MDQVGDAECGRRPTTPPTPRQCGLTVRAGPGGGHAVGTPGPFRPITA
jgi:hypothetical protein